jgi:RNA recognition motif-containing protein
MKVYKVKISYLPLDMTESELYDLLKDWGNIYKVKVLNYDEYSNAYIDFLYSDQADYFIEALNKTPFEHEIISVQKIE